MSIKIMVLILSIGLYSGTLAAQHFAVAADKMNVAYIGFDNPLTIAAEGYSCDQLVISCDNGKIDNLGDCRYNFTPENTGTSNVFVKVKTSSGLKAIGSTKFRVKQPTTPTAKIAGKSDGLILASVFKVQQGVTASYDGFDFDNPIRVVSFKIEFFRNGELLYVGNNSGAIFNETIRSQMQKLKPGDRIFVTEVKAVGPSSRVFPLNDISLTLS